MLESFYWKNSRKNLNESAAITKAIYQMWHSYKVKINRINIVQAFLLLSMPKKVKEALRARLSGNKSTWTETFVRSKTFVKWKTTLNWGTSACYENLPIKTHLKKKHLSNIVKRGKNGTNLINLSIICYLLWPSLPHFLVLIHWSLAFMNK